MEYSTAKLFHPEWPPTCLPVHTEAVSPQPFCIPVVVALVENIFHACEILLTLATNRLLESATDRRRKNEMDILEHQREEVDIQQNWVFKTPVGNKYEKWISRFSKHFQRVHLIESSWELMGENSIKLVKINIDLISYVKNIPFLTAFQCCFF